MPGMIEPIIWPHNSRVVFGEPESPFVRGSHERPLKITFHSATFADLPPEEAEALDALRQLAHLPEVEALDTANGPFPHLELGNFNIADSYVPITVTATDSITEAGIPLPHQWLEVAAHVVGQENLAHPDVLAMFADLLVARAHCELDHDILVTLSPHLLAHRTDHFVREANPRTPSETAQIMGLFLRSRDNYTWWANEHGRATTNRGLFYWVLARHRLPNMWRYHSACHVAEAVRGDDIVYLGDSILIRCVRALEARDSIGVQFYVRQNNDTRDAIMYHFDYFTLLLAGALDAQARVARRAYNIVRPNERNTSFRRQEFVNALANNGAVDLNNLVSGQHFIDIMTLLHELRNTIHGAGLPTLAVRAGVDPQESYVTVLPNYANTLWDAAERCGGVERWGLRRLHGVRLEPYSFVTTLATECFGFINSIAAVTNIDGLFPVGHVIPPLSDRPPNEEVFAEDRRRRLALLG
jgi:hypothetical protein